MARTSRCSSFPCTGETLIAGSPAAALAASAASNAGSSDTSRSLKWRSIAVQISSVIAPRFSVHAVISDQRTPQERSVCDTRWCIRTRSNFLNFLNFLNFWGSRESTRESRAQRGLTAHLNIDSARARGGQRGNLVQKSSPEGAGTRVAAGRALGGETVGGQTQRGL